MATKDISDRQVVEACAAALDQRDVTAGSMLGGETGQPVKVVMAAMERAHRRGLIECGVSLRTAWPTDAGRSLLTLPRDQN